MCLCLVLVIGVRDGGWLRLLTLGVIYYYYILYYIYIRIHILIYLFFFSSYLILYSSFPSNLSSNTLLLFPSSIIPFLHTPLSFYHLQFHFPPPFSFILHSLSSIPILLSSSQFILYVSVFIVRYLYLLILPPIPKFDPACFIGVDG